MPNHDCRINYIELPARDLDAVKAFYHKAFRWTFTDYGPDYAAFSDGHLDGGFYRASVESSAANGAALVVLYADDLEAVRDVVNGCGGRIVKPVFDFPGGRRFHFADPNGNELAVWSE